MKIKAAVFDIDGTLVPYGAPGPGQAAVQALRELAQSGVAVVIATGRARYTAQWVLGSGIKPDHFAAVNGADVTDAEGAACVAEPHDARGNVRACGFLRGP
ncbi:MAG: HAD hydrolase family protein [Ruthenibacterium lactatiformans]